MVGAAAIKALGQKILEALKRRTGARGEGYVLWGLTPEELIASLEGLAKEVPALAPRLPLYAERIRQVDRSTPPHPAPGSTPPRSRREAASPPCP